MSRKLESHWRADHMKKLNIYRAMRGYKSTTNKVRLITDLYADQKCNNNHPSPININKNIHLFRLKQRIKRSVLLNRGLRPPGHYLAVDHLEKGCKNKDD